MVIGIDVSMLNYMGSGVANYTFNLVKNLLKYDTKNEYRLFYSSLRRPKGFYYLEELRSLGGRVHEYPVPLSVWKVLWGKFHLIPVEWMIGKVDVFMSSDFLRPPLLKGTRGITTVHDLTWKIFPEYHTQDVIEAHAKKLQKTVRFKDTVVVDSENTKKDLLRYYPEIKDVHVLHLAVDDHFRVIKDKQAIKSVLKKHGLKYPANYLLYVGAIEPRKNLETAIKVFGEFISIKKYSDFKFLIVGRAGWKNEKIFEQIKKLGLEDKVVFVGFVEDKDLPYFYNASKVFIYLSKYEGFGLPPIEAAACGIPSLLYANSSLKEIFRSGYPYARSKVEIDDLKNIIEYGVKVNNFVYDFSWKKYCLLFLKFVSSI